MRYKTTTYKIPPLFANGKLRAGTRFAYKAGMMSNEGGLMREPFEDWARREIEKHRAAAAALEHALAQYLGAAKPIAGESKPAAAPDVGGAQPASRFAVVMQLIANAGSRGLTVDEMILKADEAKVTINRATLRHQLWSAKKKGKLALRYGRYVATEKPGASTPGLPVNG